MQHPPLTRRTFVAQGAAVGLAAGAVRAAADTPAGMTVSVIGDSCCIPDVGHEAACLLVNGKHLIDTGWCAALKLRQFGFNPLALDSITLTHFHQDHYLGLPQLLFYVGLSKRRGPPLQIIGPDAHLEKVVQAAVAFLQTERFPELSVDYRLVPLKAGDRFELPGLRAETFAARHTSGKNQLEQALSYKFTAAAGGAQLVYTGDTHHHPPIAEFARGASLLIHDAAHTAAKEAAAIARQAGVGRLVLIHHSQRQAERVLAEARGVFANTELAKEGATLEVPPAGKT